MKRLAIWALLAVSLSANAATVAVALRHRRTPPSDEPLIFSRVAVDPDQRARISKLRAQLVARRDEHARVMARLRGELAAAIVAGPDGVAAVEAALERISEAQAAFQRAVVEHLLAVRGVLRPEQRPPFEEIVAQRVQEGDGVRHDCPSEIEGGSSR